MFKISIGFEIYIPKDHWTLKTGYFEDPTPAIQVQTLPLEGPRSWGIIHHLSMTSQRRRKTCQQDVQDECLLVFGGWVQLATFGQYPKDPNPSKVANLRTNTPLRHTGPWTPPLEGPRILRLCYILICFGGRLFGGFTHTRPFFFLGSEVGYISIVHTYSQYISVIFF